LPIDHAIVVATFCEDGMVAFLRAVVVFLVLDFVDGGKGLVVLSERYGHHANKW
jgi:hypothetical protein